MNKLESIRKDKNLGVTLKASNNIKKHIFGDTIDELIDGLRKFNDGKFVNKFVGTFSDLTEEQLEQLDGIMAKTSDAEEIFKYAEKRKKLSNRKDIEERLVELKEYHYIAKYATKCEVDNIDLLVDCVSKGDTVYAITEIAHAKGADLIKLKDAIFDETKFDSNSNRIMDAILTFCSYWQKESNIITVDDVRKVEQLSIDNRFALYAKICAEKIKGVNIERLQKRVEESGNAEQMYKFAKDVEGADINSLRVAIKKATYNIYSNSIDWREEFVKKFGPDLVEENKKRRIFRRKKD